MCDLEIFRIILKDNILVKNFCRKEIENSYE